MRPGRLRDLVVGLGTAAALTGCGTQSCTAVGCVSGVDVDLTRATALLGPGPVSTRLCVGESCRRADLDDAALEAGARILQDQLTSPVGPGAGPAQVTLTVTRAGTTLVDVTTTVTLKRVAPNGERCGPVCFYAALALDPSGRLVAAAEPLPTPRPS